MPSNLSHFMAQSLLSVHLIGGPLMRILRSTTTSYNITVIFPTWRWNENVSSLHLFISRQQGPIQSHQPELRMKEKACLSDVLNDVVILLHALLHDREWPNISMTPRSWSFAHNYNHSTLKKMHNFNIQINIHKDILGSSRSEWINVYLANTKHQNWLAQGP